MVVSAPSTLEHNEPVNETPRLDVSAAFELRSAELVRSAERAAGENDASALLELRVAARRLRAAVELFQPAFPNRLRKRARKALKRLSRIGVRTGDVQHVLLAEAHTASTDLAEKATIEHVLEQIDGERAAQRSSLLEKIEDIGPAHVAALLERLAAKAAGDDRPKRRARRAFKLFDGLIDDAFAALPDRTALESADALKRAHSAVRALRYSLEAVVPSLQDVADLVRPIAELEQVLGTLLDRSELLSMLDEQRAELVRNGRNVLGDQIARLVERTRGQSRALGERAVALAQQLDRERLSLDLRSALGVKPKGRNGHEPPADDNGI